MDVCFEFDSAHDQIGVSGSQLAANVTTWMIPKLTKHSRKRVRRLLGIEDVDVKRKAQLHALLARLRMIHDEEKYGGIPAQVAATAVDAFTALALAAAESPTESVDDQLAKWEAAEACKPGDRRIVGHLVNGKSLSNLSTAQFPAGFSSCSSTFVPAF